MLSLLNGITMLYFQKASQLFLKTDTYIFKHISSALQKVVPVNSISILVHIEFWQLRLFTLNLNNTTQGFCDLLM
jgi:hypothetical protein